MSRFYEMTLRVDLAKQPGYVLSPEETIDGIDPETLKVLGVFSHLWDDPDGDFMDGTIISLAARGHLTGGESSEEFTERLSQAVWKALGRFVPVEVDATFLDIQPPTDTHRADLDAYQKWKQSVS